MRLTGDDVVSLLDSILCIFVSKFVLRSKSCSKLLEEYLFSSNESSFLVVAVAPEAIGVFIILSEMLFLIGVLGVGGAAFVLEIDLEGLVTPV